MDFNSFLSDLGLDQQGMLWLQVFLAVFVAMLASLLATKVLRQLQRQVEKTKNFWDDILIDSVRRPLIVMIWMLGISWAINIIATESDAAIFEAVSPIRDMAVILLLTWFVVRLIRNTEAALISPDKREDPLDETTVAAVGKLMRVSIIITATLVVLQTLGYSISGVLAFGGIGGIAIGFAAKDLLANFFGGLMVYLDRPFVVGEWVRSPDREIEGTVEAIGWRLTKIRTFDKRPLYVPNSTFANITVENPSRMTNRRIYETIGLRYDDARQLAAIVADVKTMLQEHEEIDQEQTMIVNFDAYGDSSLDFFVYTFTETTDWVFFHEVKQDVLMKILDVIYKHGADVAFPTSTVHLPDFEGKQLPEPLAKLESNKQA